MGRVSDRLDGLSPLVISAAPFFRRHLLTGIYSWRWFTDPPGRAPVGPGRGEHFIPQFMRAPHMQRRFPPGAVEEPARATSVSD